MLPPRSFQEKIDKFKAEIFDPLIQYLIVNRHQVAFAKKTLNRIETILVQYRLNLLLQILEKKSVEMAQDLEKGTKQIEDVWSFLSNLVGTNLLALEDLKPLLDETGLKKTVLQKLSASTESLSEAEFDSAMERLFAQTKSIREKMNGMDVKKLAKFGSFAALPQDFFKIDDAIDELQTEIVHTQ